MKKDFNKKKLAPQMAPTSDEQYLYDGGISGDPGAGYDPLTAGIQRSAATKEAALKQMLTPASNPRPIPPQPSTPPDDPARAMYNSEGNQATLANQANYEKQFKAKDAANAAAEQAYQDKQNALEDGMADGGEVKYGNMRGYSEGGEVSSKTDRFKKLRGKMKANSEAEASKNPMKFIEDNKSMSIRGKKGVAF